MGQLHPPQESCKVHHEKQLDLRLLNIFHCLCTVFQVTAQNLVNCVAKLWHTSTEEYQIRRNRFLVCSFLLNMLVEMQLIHS